MEEILPTTNDEAENGMRGERVGRRSEAWCTEVGRDADAVTKYFIVTCGGERERMSTVHDGLLLRFWRLQAELVDVIALLQLDTEWDFGGWRVLSAVVMVIGV